MKVGFVGLGVMGFPMAGHLAAAGHDVVVYNRTASKADEWLSGHSGRSAPTPGQASDGADIVFLCVGNDDDVRDVCTGPDGVFASHSSGAIVVDHTTASAELAREMAAAAQERSLGFLDAPVSGGQAGAENGQLTVMVGGEQAVFQRAEPVMSAYARCVRLLGPSGSGQLAKMVNQVCIAGLVQGLSEGMLLSERARTGYRGCDRSGSRRAPRSPGKWKTVTRPCWPVSTNMALRLTGMRKDPGYCTGRSRPPGYRATCCASCRRLLRRGPGDGRRAVGYLQSLRPLTERFINGRLFYSDIDVIGDRMQQEDFNRGLCDFISTAVTPFHAVSRMMDRLQSAGYTLLAEDAPWQL